MIFQIAWANLVLHRRRNAALAGAIIASMCLLLVMVGLGAGLHQAMLESVTSLITGHVNIEGYYKLTPSKSAPVLTRSPELRAAVQRHVPEVRSMLERSHGYVKAIGPKRSLDLELAGVDVEKEDRLRGQLRFREGRIDGLEKVGGLILFTPDAERLGVRVGDTVVLSTPTLMGTYNTVDAQVVGISEVLGALSEGFGFVGNATIRALYQQGEGTTGALMLYLDSPESANEVRTRLHAALAADGYRVMDPDARPFWLKLDDASREDWVGQKVAIETWEAAVEPLAWTVGVLDALTGLLGFVLVVVICLGTMNSQWISIRERTREIGTLRAIGMQRRSVLAAFMLESFLLSAISTAAGVALGVLLSLGINLARIPAPGPLQFFVMRDHFHLSLRPGSVLIAAAVIVLGATFISVFSSVRAARLKPVTAMQHIG